MLRAVTVYVMFNNRFQLLVATMAESKPCRVSEPVPQLAAESALVKSEFDYKNAQVSDVVIAQHDSEFCAVGVVVL